MREKIKIVSQKKNKETSSLSQSCISKRIKELLNKQQLKKRMEILLKRKELHSMTNKETVQRKTTRYQPRCNRERRESIREERIENRLTNIIAYIYSWRFNGRYNKLF